MSMKNPLTPAGIEPVTLRFVARHLNHCATAVPLSVSKCSNLRVLVFILQGEIDPEYPNKQPGTLLSYSPHKF